MNDESKYEYCKTCGGKKHCLKIIGKGSLLRIVCPECKGTGKEHKKKRDSN